MSEPLTVDRLGETPQGVAVERYMLRNANGLRADIMTYGAILMRLETPDAEGRRQNIVLGFDALAPYLAGTPYFGATVGRYANRIAAARFAIDGREYRLAANNGRNHLHGGVRGFDKVVWGAEPFAHDDGAGVVLRHLSEDGDEGYPGALQVEVRYTLTADDRLTIDYRARTSAPTHVNLTHHSYFNLSGDASRNIESHDLVINADRFTPVDDELIPIGDPQTVDDTPFDFRTAQRIGERIDQPHPQLRAGAGYDHNLVLNKSAPGALGRAALLRDPESGRVMEVWTTEPGLQFYSGNQLDGAFSRRTGLCLEPQHFPNTPNRPDFPSTLLRPGETYQSRTELVFRTD